ncbi:MAG: hypothetical protein J2P48_12715 [Alphaproteobacteria bacterium]|nr:hypothetical protein [Alphaproteobacteria bacterium]
MNNRSVDGARPRASSPPQNTIEAKRQSRKLLGPYRVKGNKLPGQVPVSRCFADSVFAAVPSIVEIDGGHAGPSLRETGPLTFSSFGEVMPNPAAALRKSMGKLGRTGCTHPLPPQGAGRTAIR